MSCVVLCCVAFSSKQGAATRVSEDFMPMEPTFQTLHVAASDHYTAEFHAAARALGGCPVYVSDKPGSHNFNVLKKLVLPDGSILRARYAGRPARDCLFSDPVLDGKSPRWEESIEDWNLNKFSGVIGVFNCHRAGKWPPTAGAPYEPLSESTPLPLSGLVSPLDVDLLEEVTNESWRGERAVYAFYSGSLSVMPKKENFEVPLGVLECEVFTISPIRVFGPYIKLAPIGLLDMYNSGGAIESLHCKNELSECVMKVRIRGCG
ncbi:unnamed protein product [Prunus armeniaca]|uniref:Galactinol--sucrose galactosyltransferase n=1 Tax=Prunus armeniaca TaxID=36596 RepID=A0A6J5XJ83_PRUAR|nr:unnamed protein product [Prunus armeniaca]CAB4311068.1 unnamed protein product [Prunus armeniaca]